MVALFFALILNTASASPFRVLVFPHQGTYPVPQGQETVVSQVTITSAAVCNQFLGQINAQNEWEKTGTLINSQTSFSLSHFNAGDAFYFECTQPFTVHRDENLTAYSYSGNFVAKRSADGTDMIEIINLINPETYTQGVVASEVGSTWPVEALKSQAVAARTFAWWTVLNQKANATEGYDLNDTVEYQAYTGNGSQTPITDSAVAATANQVMEYNGSVIKAYFSADSGGYTESAKDAFGQDLPYCAAKKELYDVSISSTGWEADFSLSDLGAGLGYGKTILGVSVSPEDFNESGRVDQVTITTRSGQVAKIPGTVFRFALNLRSTLFTLKTVLVNGQDVVQVRGGGHGHGVGMAQVGAREYADQFGWTYDQILKFYYTGITLETAFEDASNQ